MACARELRAVCWCCYNFHFTLFFLLFFSAPKATKKKNFEKLSNFSSSKQLNKTQRVNFHKKQFLLTELMLFSLFIPTFSLSFNLFYAFLFIVLCKKTQLNSKKLMKHKTYFGFRRRQQRQKINVVTNVMSETLDMIRIGKM